MDKQISRFIVAGISAVATDYFSYLVLSQFVGLSIAKASSFIAGSVVAFIINKYWTFNAPRRSGAEVFRFAILYTSTLFANVLMNNLVLLFGSMIFAFLVATGTSTVLNFLGMKFWVFQPDSGDKTSNG